MHMLADLRDRHAKVLGCEQGSLLACPHADQVVADAAGGHRYGGEVLGDEALARRRGAHPGPARDEEMTILDLWSRGQVCADRRYGQRIHLERQVPASDMQG